MLSDQCGLYLGKRQFEYVRECNANVTKTEERLGCFIKGLRPRVESPKGANWQPSTENCIKIVRLEGCDYSISTEQIAEPL